MDNLYIKEIWNDMDIKEWKITAKNQYVMISQTIYIQEKQIHKLINKINEFLKSKNKIYIEIGKKDGNYTPAMSISIEQINSKGNVCIELDMEVADSEERKHRCSLYVMTDLSAIEKVNRDLIQREKDISLYRE